MTCQDITEINRLWQEYSEDRFGFNVQKQIYLETTTELDEYSEENYRNFRYLVQDRVFSDDEIPSGYYPTLSTIYPKQKSLHSLAHWILLYRTQICGL